MRDDLSLQLSRSTGIDRVFLQATEKHDLEEMLSGVSIARRMSWASKRVTARTEDLAYCLLGIFSVNLPLLYGEGERAFLRLQEEIIKQTNDLSILAWTWEDADKSSRVFARHPCYFQNSHDIALTKELKHLPDFALTNKGLKIETRLGIFQPIGDLFVLRLG